jgi:hypothetical protein
VGDRLLEYEVGGATVRLLAPDTADFNDITGLPAGERNLTWSTDGGFFMISTGAGAGHTPDGMLASERDRAEEFELLSDSPVPVAGRGARRIAFRSAHRIARSMEMIPTGERIERDETKVSRVADFLFVPGPDHIVRIGYRAEEKAPVRQVFTRMLDRAQVSW